LKITGLGLGALALAVGAACAQSGASGAWPMSNLLSPEARALAPPTEGPGSRAPALPTEREVGIAKLRELMGANLQPNVDRMLATYPVDVQETTMGGVSVAVITPKGGVPERNRNRVMINAPGGGFRTGIRPNGLMVSIPVANLGQMKVITILYRQGPEARFPAATEDFTAVYREVLKTHRPQNIGVFGCSAGGALVSQSVAHFIKTGIPKPAVMGVYCAGMASGGGDSTFISAASAGQPVDRAMGETGGMGGQGPDGYYAGMDVKNPDITPANDPTLLARFPPVFLLTATRDFAMSNALLTHRRLLQAGVESQVVVMDGLGHGFMTNALLPETREGQTAAVRFYDRHLGR
jgi:acetyl esterase/lipase